MDLITQLPTTKEGHDAVAVLVDRLSKITHFAATHTSATAEDMARLFVSTVFKQHGLPRNIVSDRDPRFTSKFWKALTRLLLGTHCYMSTAFHLQTDGQTERMNRLLEETLRHYISPTTIGKITCRLIVVVNNAWQESIGTTMLNGGRQPRTPADLGFKAMCLDSAEHFSANLRERRTRAKVCLEAAQQRQRKHADKTKENGRGVSTGSGSVAQYEEHFVQVPWNAQVVAPLDRSLLHRKGGGTCGARPSWFYRQKCAYIQCVFHMSLLR
jgi:hypothetical protein